MSSLIFDLSPEAVVLATDTLATDPDGTPAYFTSKALFVPHLKTIIAGTGCAGFSTRWAQQVTDKMLLRGIENLDYHTPQGLSVLWEEYQRSEDFPEGMTTTVYQLGLSEDAGVMKGFAYRSADGFVSEPLNYGMRMKPECSVPEGQEGLEIFRTMMLEQREIQSKKERSERVYIGGQGIVMILDANSCTTATLFDFDDFLRDSETAFSNI